MKCYINGYLHSMQDPKKVYHKMATQDGQIIAFDEEVDLLSCDDILDLKGAHLYPGFVDAHLHMLGYGEYLQTINLFGCHDKKTIAKKIKASQDELVFAIGYLDIGLTKHDLDQMISDRIVVLRHNDFHGLTLNSYALSYFKVEDDTGILKEAKASYILKNIPKPPANKLKKILSASIDQLASYGLTGGHSDDLNYYNGFEETYHVFEEVLKDKPFRAHLLMHHEIIDDYIKSHIPWGVVHPYLELGAVKMFYDGTMSSKTALMFHPYRNEETQGEVVMGKDEFVKTMIKMRSLGLSLAIHVIGDKGLDEVVDLLTLYPPLPHLIDRIIHAPWAEKLTIDKMKKLPLTIDIQPQFLSSDLPRAFQFFSKNPSFIFPWKSYLDQGLLISGSSDAPVEIPNPLYGIKDAIYRRSTENHMIYEPSEALTHFEAIKLYTTYAHPQSFLQKRGYLKEGYLADFTVLDCDIERLEEEEFSKPHVVMTIVDEKIIYKRD